VSLSFSSEKSYSPSMLIWAHDIGECADVSRSKFSLASTFGAFSICSIILCRITYLCWNRPSFLEASFGLGDVDFDGATLGEGERTGPDWILKLMDECNL
jgi:hypothetical protein